MSVSIDLDALVGNCAVLKKTVGAFYCVLKCNAYGHGAADCASALYSCGMRKFAVFSLAEALEIHPNVGDSDVLILGRTAPEELSAVSEKGFLQTVPSEEYARLLSDLHGRLRLHIKVDTGMNRSGFFPDAERIASALKKRVRDTEGAYTHFPCADGDDLSDTRGRLSAFSKIARDLEDLLKKRLTKHSAASAAAVRLPESRLDLSRIGLLLYGALPRNTEIGGIRPVMSLYGRIIGVRTVKKGDSVGYGRSFICQRDSVIATVGCGYADGVRRSLAGRFSPAVMGHAAPLIAVCMDRCMLDVTDLAEGGISIGIGNTVTFFGDGMPPDEAATASGTISYEILTSCGKARI